MLKSGGLWAGLISMVLLLVADPTAAQVESRLHERFTEQVESLRDELVEVRRDLHLHPEVSGAEERTAGIVAQRLAALGLEVRTGVGGHGVIGVVRGRSLEPLVAFRADMDAVPSSAPDPVDFRSLTEGVRHICGHDIHTTIGLALAEGLAAIRDELPGSVMLLFQPAEERATGAKAMIADGALETPRPEAIFAYHTAPLEVGQLATASTAMMAGRDRVRVELRGEGDLEEAVEAVRQTLLQIGTVDPAAATQPPSDDDFILAQIAAPSKSGDGSWVVGGSMTLATAEARQRAERRVREDLEALSLVDVELEVEYEPKFIAGVTNDPQLVARASGAAREVLGDDAVLPTGGIVPAFSEDFGSFQDEVPGVMFFLGVSNAERGWVGMPHSPGYIADEDSIFVGTSAMAAILLDALGRAEAANQGG